MFFSVCGVENTTKSKRVILATIGLNAQDMDITASTQAVLNLTLIIQNGTIPGGKV